MVCISDERQGIAVHPVSIGGELHPRRLDRPRAIVNRHSTGIAAEYRKAWLWLHGSGQSAVFIAPDRGDHRPGSASTAQLAGACRAVGIPEPKRLIADIDEIDLLVGGQILDDEGRSGRCLVD